MKINHEIKLIRKDTRDDFSLIMPNKDDFTKKIKYHFSQDSKLEVDLLITVEKANAKTNKQLAYYYCEILPKTLIAYKELGWNINNENQADMLLKKHCGFVFKIVNEKTGEVEEFYKSKSKMKIDEMANLIDFAINEVCANAGVEVNEPTK